MTKRDLERIAFVTKHFDRMRAGLVVAGLGPVVLALLAARRSPPWVYISLIGAALLIMWAGDRWTARRFGRVVPAQRRGALSFLWRLLLGVVIGRLWTIDNHWLGAGRPSLALIYLGAVLLWISIREWPFRRYQCALPVIAFAGAIAHMGVVTDADLVLWRLAAGGSVVVAAMAVGILDYLMVVRVFGAARSPEKVDANA
jgi:hypothetical protein